MMELRRGGGGQGGMRARRAALPGVCVRQSGSARRRRTSGGCGAREGRFVCGPTATVRVGAAAAAVRLLAPPVGFLSVAAAEDRLHVLAQRPPPLALALAAAPGGAQCAPDAGGGAGQRHTRHQPPTAVRPGFCIIWDSFLLWRRVLNRWYIYYNTAHTPRCRCALLLTQRPPARRGAPGADAT